jgi:hypothetical protein
MRGEKKKIERVEADHFEEWEDGERDNVAEVRAHEGEEARRVASRVIDRVKSDAKSRLADKVEGQVDELLVHVDELA